MRCDDHVYPLVADYFVENVEVVGSVQGIMQKRIFQWKLRGLVNNEAGGASLPPADMEMGDMHFVTQSQFLKNIVMTGRYRVMDIILCGNKEDLHLSKGIRNSAVRQVFRMISFWI
jgi:hypothetical protein